MLSVLKKIKRLELRLWDLLRRRPYNTSNVKRIMFFFF